MIIIFTIYVMSSTEADEVCANCGKAAVDDVNKRLLLDARYSWGCNEKFTRRVKQKKETRLPR